MPLKVSINDAFIWVSDQLFLTVFRFSINCSIDFLVSDQLFGRFVCVRSIFLKILRFSINFSIKLSVFDRLFGQTFGFRSTFGSNFRVSSRANHWKNENRHETVKERSPGAGEHLSGVRISVRVFSYNFWARGTSFLRFCFLSAVFRFFFDKKISKKNVGP